MNKKKNVVDKFLDLMYSQSLNNTEKKKIYYRPTKKKALIGFIISLFFMLIMLFHFLKFSFIFFLLILGDSIALLYYGINLFTKKGLLIPKYIYVDKDNK